MCRQWNEWMISGEHSFTTAGNTKAASLATVCEWVVKSWAEVKTECTVKSFKKCSNSNTMDGTGDDLLWQEDDEDVVTRETIINQDEDETELENPYDDIVTTEEWDMLFRESDDEEFDGFKL